MAYDQCMQVILDLALDKTDREAAQYICDRLKGRPHQSIDNRIRAEIVYTNADHLLAIEEARNYTIKVLGGNDGQSVTKGEDSVTSEALQGEA